tara:strand:- start:2794 stop:3261 length:468 start_codon:yes stop_codon:yes gene_type:complete
MEIEFAELDNWDRRFFELCNLLASWSEDRSRKVGAVIVGGANQIISTGYNGLPRAIANHDSRHGRAGQEKYFWFEHAERNALFNAARSGNSTDGCRMYANLFPCAECARGIIQSGIVQLNSFSPPVRDETFERSFSVSTEMLSEANIEVRFFRSP